MGVVTFPGSYVIKVFACNSWGVSAKMATIILRVKAAAKPLAMHFPSGARYLCLCEKSGDSAWTVANAVCGAEAAAQGADAGENVLGADAGEDANGKPSFRGTPPTTSVPRI